MFDEKILNAIKDSMVKHDETLAVAESVTSGLLQSAFSNAKDASLFFQGGISAYNVGQKVKHLCVEPIHAIAHNCVSAKISQQMSLNVCTMFQSDWGISITGYAVPVAESNNELFAYYSIAYKNKILKHGRMDAKAQDPSAVKLFYIEQILKNVYNLIQISHK